MIRGLLTGKQRKHLWKLILQSRASLRSHIELELSPAYPETIKHYKEQDQRHLDELHAFVKALEKDIRLYAPSEEP